MTEALLLIPRFILALVVVCVTVLGCTALCLAFCIVFYWIASAIAWIGIPLPVVGLALAVAFGYWVRGKGP